MGCFLSISVVLEKYLRILRFYYHYNQKDTVCGGLFSRCITEQIAAASLWGDGIFEKLNEWEKISKILWWLFCMLWCDDVISDVGMMIIVCASYVHREVVMIWLWIYHNSS